MLGRGGDRARKALFDRLAALPESDPRRTAVRDRLVIGHLELAMHIAKCYSAKGADETELLRAAFTGLVRAVDGFDPAQGDFLAYAIPSMMDEVRRRPEAETDPVPVSRALAAALEDLDRRLREAPEVGALRTSRT
ncbi:sigma factor [Glycomyces mayteni]